MQSNSFSTSTELVRLSSICLCDCERDMANSPSWVCYCKKSANFSKAQMARHINTLAHPLLWQASAAGGHMHHYGAYVQISAAMHAFKANNAAETKKASRGKPFQFDDSVRITPSSKDQTRPDEWSC